MCWRAAVDGQPHSSAPHSYVCYVQVGRTCPKSMFPGALGKWGQHTLVAPKIFQKKAQSRSNLYFNTSSEKQNKKEPTGFISVSEKIGNQKQRLFPSSLHQPCPQPWTNLWFVSISYIGLPLLVQILFWLPLHQARTGHFWLSFNFQFSVAIY